MKPHLFLVTIILLSNLNISISQAQKIQWINYHGEFATFKIPWDYQVILKKEKNKVIYKIFNPIYQNSILIISNKNKKIQFSLYTKEGYKLQEEIYINHKDYYGPGKRGIDKKHFNWREQNILYRNKNIISNQGIIYAYYKNAPGKIALNFDKIIESIKIKKTLEYWTYPKTP